MRYTGSPRAVEPAVAAAGRTALAVLIGTLLAGAAGAQGVAPWSRTEVRTPCSSFDDLRQPFFGETHVHTDYSADAVFTQALGGPREAYEFGKGQPIGLPPLDGFGAPTRSAQLRRPLDFVAVTDHAEGFGEVQICQDAGLDPNLPNGYDETECVDLRAQIAAPLQPLPSFPPPAAFQAFLIPYGILPNPQRFGWCGAGGADCLGAAALVWQDTKEAAEEHYDRTAACQFTTFVAYEWSATPGGNNLHRNVIFRNEKATALPISYIEANKAQLLWSDLQSQCLDPGTGIPGCDVLTIPHNSNASNGLMFVPENADGSPLSPADAAFRARMEPVVEITQHKGDSECRVGVGGATDEQCGYEKINRRQLFSPVVVTDPASYSPRSFVRGVLKEGLELEESLGVNPFALGVIGATDDHNAAPGSTEEADFGTTGHIGLGDRDPAFILQRNPPAGISSNPGGLGVVWAEENSRDAIFEAMRRREVYATSGTRPIVRLFAGRISRNVCNYADFVSEGYLRGAPMGAAIGAVRGRRSPRFAVLAQKDPGTLAAAGTPLQQVQIVKGWVDATGTAQEQVFEVAGDPDNGASVDEDTCTANGPGFDSLCAVWEDPTFDPDQRAFYYARVLENPTCRWSAYVCNGLALDCNDPGSVPAEYGACCDATIPKTIQERAWTSPIFYRPEAIRVLAGRIQYGDAPGSDLLKLQATIHRLPAGLDPALQDVSVSVSDDDSILDLTIPAGTLSLIRPGLYRLKDPSGTVLPGITEVVLRIGNSGQGKLSLKTAATDLSNADAVDHIVEVRISIGSYEASHSRRWSVSSDGKRLGSKS